MQEVICQKIERIGSITLNRPEALNALTYGMISKIEETLELWRNDNSVSLVILDAKGDRAFCSGGDIADLYTEGIKGNFSFGQKFWRDEYRLNAKIYEYTKPIVSFLHGFTMGGGVGIGCHASHRIVGESSRIAMPECGIGLMPDVGGSLILSKAAAGLGIYLGTTCTRMDAADSIYTGFADTFVPEKSWHKLKEELISTGNWKIINDFKIKPKESNLKRNSMEIKKFFSGKNHIEIIKELKKSKSKFAEDAFLKIKKVSPLSMACTVKLINELEKTNSIRKALNLEYRFTFRASEFGDFLEGIRAQIIEKDRKPLWKHESSEKVSIDDVSYMLASLKDKELNIEEML